MTKEQYTKTQSVGNMCGTYKTKLWILCVLGRDTAVAVCFFVGHKFIETMVPLLEVHFVNFPLCSPQFGLAGTDPVFGEFYGRIIRGEVGLNGIAAEERGALPLLAILVPLALPGTSLRFLV
jgi:hypothetical protein